ncbi:hypothetical protein V7147_20210, partial [Bacillus sp. JJ1521]
MKRKEKRTKAKFWAYVFGYSLAIFMTIPLLWMVISSFKTPGSTVTVLFELFAPPYTLDSFRKVLEPGESAMMMRWTFNSVYVGIVQT